MTSSGESDIIETRAELAVGEFLQSARDSGAHEAADWALAAKNAASTLLAMVQVRKTRDAEPARRR